VGNFSRPVTASSQPQRLEVRAPNYITQAQDIIFDRTQAVTISLQKEKRGSSGGKAPAPRTATQPQQQQQQQPASIFDAPRRTPRSLDNQNPFGNKE